MYFVLKSLKFIYFIPLYMFRTQLYPSSGATHYKNVLRGSAVSVCGWLVLMLPVLNLRSMLLCMLICTLRVLLSHSFIFF